MLASLLIVFREVIEAGLIVGIVLAATQGVPRRALWIAYGVGGGVLGACLVAGFAGKIEAMFQGSGQELFNASILLIAVVMLTWHNVWMAGHGREMAREMRQMGAEVKSGERTLTALSIVVGVAVLREGAEVVLFLYGIASQPGTTTASLLTGGALGMVAGAAMSALMYYGLLAIPAHKLFRVTSGLITLLAAGMAAQAVLFLQQAGYLEALTIKYVPWMHAPLAINLSSTIWNTAWLLPEDSIVGRLLHTLIGYSDAPDGAQLVAYGVTIAAIVILMVLEQDRQARLKAAAAPAPVAAE